ncbi:MAG: hypothetical protein R3D85_16595 [Paracoccaceae bacterium]
MEQTEITAKSWLMILTLGLVWGGTFLFQNLALRTTAVLGGRRADRLCRGADLARVAAAQAGGCSPATAPTGRG